MQHWWILGAISFASAVVAETLNIELNGYALLFNALPYRFYCILMLVFVLATILFNRDFGPMHTAQRRAAEAPARSRAFAP